MKSILKMGLIVSIVLMTGFTKSVAQTANDKARFAYVVKKLKLSHNLSTKLAPSYFDYLKELHTAKDIYENLKDKYKETIKKRALTREQATLLLSAHWASDDKVAEIRKRYTSIFAKTLSVPYVYYLFSLTNDKKSKVMG